MKICIIGGSIAGLECGINLGEDFNVHIFEEHCEIGKPLKCAEGWITFTGIKPYIRSRKIEKLVINLLNDSLKIHDYFEVKVDAFSIVNRPKMEQKMADIAEKKGVEITTGRKMTITEALKNFDFIIDASGYPSQWCREFGSKKPYGFAMQTFYDIDYDSAYVFFKEGFDGYFWIFPDAEYGCKVGVGVFTVFKNPLRKILDKFLDVQGFPPVSKLTASPLGCYFNRPFLRYAKVPVALVGDAAGIVDRGGGEGMTKAIISARILSECIKKGTVSEYERKYFNYMRLHYFATNFFSNIQKKWKILKVYGKAGILNLMVDTLRLHYSKLSYSDYI